MKTISAIEAQINIIETIDRFRELAKLNPNGRMSAFILNVGFSDIFIVYSRLKTKYKQIYLPKDTGKNVITIIYVVCPGVSITIESEPCLNLKPKLNSINYN
jgi:hypothetical protein